MQSVFGECGPLIVLAGVMAVCGCATNVVTPMGGLTACATDGECTGVGCQMGVCVDAVCMLQPNPARCELGTRCDPSGACRPRQRDDGDRPPSDPTREDPTGEDPTVGDPPPDTATCAPELVTLSRTPSCSPQTRSCLGACADPACEVRCLMLGGQQCAACYERNLFSCVNARGCQGQFDCYAECASAGCAVGDTACVDTMCAAEQRAYFVCSDTVDDCGAELGLCFSAG